MNVSNYILGIFRSSKTQYKTNKKQQKLLLNVFSDNLCCFLFVRINFHQVKVEHIQYKTFVQKVSSKVDIFCYNYINHRP